MNEWKQYRRRGLSEMRPHIPGESMEGISVSTEDLMEIETANDTGDPSGGMVARNPKNHADQWYVNAAYFAENLEPAEEKP